MLMPARPHFFLPLPLPPSFLPSPLPTALEMPLATAPTASFTPCCSAHLPTGAAAFSASAPTCTVTLAAVVTPVDAALPAQQATQMGARAGVGARTRARRPASQEQTR